MTSSTGFRAQSDALESHFGIKLDPSLAVPVRSANVNRSNANWPLPLVTSETVCAFFFFNNRAPTEIYTLSLHDALPIRRRRSWPRGVRRSAASAQATQRPHP